MCEALGAGHFIYLITFRSNEDSELKYQRLMEFQYFSQSWGIAEPELEPTAVCPESYSHSIPLLKS